MVVEFSLNKNRLEIKKNTQIYERIEIKLFNPNI